MSQVKWSAWQRAERAGRLFQLQMHVENGKQTAISPNLRSYVQGLIALAWKRGYDAGKRHPRRSK